MTEHISWCTSGLGYRSRIIFFLFWHLGCYTHVFPPSFVGFVLYYKAVPRLLALLAFQSNFSDRLFISGRVGKNPVACERECFTV